MNWNVDYAVQLEAKESVWRAEWTARLEEERQELERQLAEEKAAQAAAAEAAVASLADERRTWQQRIDVLLEKTRYLLAEKERLEKHIRQEVETQVQVRNENGLFFIYTQDQWPYFSLSISLLASLRNYHQFVQLPALVLYCQWTVIIIPSHLFLLFSLKK